MNRVAILAAGSPIARCRTDGRLLAISTTTLEQLDGNPTPVGKRHVILWDTVLNIHGTKHWWERLRWICDVAELINGGLIHDGDRAYFMASCPRLSITPQS